MSHKNNHTPLSEWLCAATVDEVLLLARLAETSKAYLYQLANGTRIASAQTAANLEMAVRVVNNSLPREMPHVDRTSLCPACTKCPYAQMVLDSLVPAGAT